MDGHPWAFSMQGFERGFGKQKNKKCEKEE
jgi:hypothetical protein